MRERDQTPITKSRGDESRSRLGGLVPLLVFGGIILIVANQQIPMVNDFVQSVIAPTKHRAVQTCRAAALGLSEKPEFARVVQGGTGHATSGGFFVQSLVIGEMAPRGGEAQFVVDCYTDADGKLVRADRVTRQRSPAAGL